MKGSDGVRNRSALTEYRADDDNDSSRPALDLSNNSIPFAPLPNVRQAIEDEIGRAADYPSASYGMLRRAIAGFVGCEPDEVVAGPGSVGVLAYLLQQVAAGGGRVVYAVPAFDAYERVVVGAGGRPVPVHGSGNRWQPLNLMVKTAGQNASAILICAPHNPTGEHVSLDELEIVLSVVPRDTVVVVDEAYIEFDQNSEMSATIEMTRRYPNLVVLRTFSKAYGLAGLRVGYAIGHRDLIGACRAVAMPFGVNRLGVAAAIASIDANAEIMDRVDSIISCRSLFNDSVQGSGIKSSDSFGNFIWLPTCRTTSIVEYLAKSGIVVREYPGIGIRITVPELDQIADVTNTLEVGYKQGEENSCR